MGDHQLKCSKYPHDLRGFSKTSQVVVLGFMNHHIEVKGVTFPETNLATESLGLADVVSFWGPASWQVLC